MAIRRPLLRIVLIAGLALALVATAPFKAFASANDDETSAGSTAALASMPLVAGNAATLNGDGASSSHSYAAETAALSESRTTAKTVKGTFVDGAIHKVMSKRARYSDAYFTKVSTKPQKNLAKLSMLASATAYGKDGSKKDRSSYSVDLLEQCGFVDYTNDGKPKYKYRASEIYNNNFVSYAIGAKKIGSFTVIAVWIKGTDKSYEWVSNFNIGTGETHKGFALAEEKLSKSVKSFMKRYRITGKVKWWITGHSRGASVANLFAKRQTDAYGKKNVYAYTFASPRVSTAAKKAGYENILNYLNPGDFITEVPPSKWGYGRYGRDLAFSSKKFSSMKAKFEKASGVTYNGYQPAEMKSLMDALLDYVGGEDVRAYYKKNPATGIAPVTFFKQGIAYFLAGNNYGLITAARIAAVDPKAAKVLAKMVVDGNGIVSNKINHAHCQLSYLCWLDVR